MLKIVLDTNVLLQIVSARSEHHWLWLELIAGKITLCVTTDILNEYIEKLEWFYGDTVFAEYILDTILKFENLIKAEKYFFWGLPVADEDDQKFVDCYVVCGAKYLVTEDRVFFRELPPIPFPKVIPIKPRDFIKIYKEFKPV